MKDILMDFLIYIHRTNEEDLEIKNISQNEIKLLIEKKSYDNENEEYYYKTIEEYYKYNETLYFETSDKKIMEIHSIIENTNENETTVFYYFFEFEENSFITLEYTDSIDEYELRGYDSLFLPIKKEDTSFKFLDKNKSEELKKIILFSIKNCEKKHKNRVKKILSKESFEKSLFYIKSYIK